ncbi:MAG TPA: hypothetical protein PKZ84_05360 [Anaerolineae bacterium]|nr:hypothetical protein [Anaerolineae bacterium]HQI83721.1 hypothetical protein [Anaerolineae bacterium]
MADHGPHNRRIFALPALFALVTTSVFLIVMRWRAGAAGFPLDDAWIHQTYARNLALHGEFSFVLGQPSAGSTAPLWTLLLAPGYWLGLAPFVWAWALGALSLIGAALAAAYLARGLFPEEEHPTIPVLAALVVAGEWHLVWSAASGMETALFAAGVLALLGVAVRWARKLPTPRQAFLGGVGIGALTLTRPEGVLLSGILGLALLISLWRRWSVLVKYGLIVGAGLLLVVLPYVALNLHLSGAPFPNTFYAKQQEYGILYTLPLLTRLFRLWPTLLAGPLVMLILALPWALDDPRRAPGQWLPLVWVVGTWVLYAWRLPVTYQHGRYLIPIIPPLLVYGTGGLRRFWRKARSGWRWIVTRAWAAATALVLISFLWLGADIFATDVAIINGEMVDVAQWINTHTAPDTHIAAHDIGALGYFAQRPLLDLAGLVSPEVIPFIRDEAQLLAWMEARQAEYLVTFPSWYPTLVADPRLELVYQTDTALTRAHGEDNMAIYRCRWP